MPLKPSAQKVQDALAAAGFSNQVVELPDSTRTAAEAARAVGCTVGQIAKSLVFRATQTGQAVLVIASGEHRVDEALLASALGEPVGKADADFVRDRTGFAIGGVAPIGHPGLPILVDEALLGYAEIWAAAGHPKAVFRLKPAALVAMTGGRVVRLAAESSKPH